MTIEIQDKLVSRLIEKSWHQFSDLKKLFFISRFQDYLNYFSRFKTSRLRYAKFKEKLDRVLETEARASKSAISCAKGCSACCYMPVSVFPSEARFLAGLIAKGRINVNWAEFEKQKDMSAEDWFYNPRPCVFLRNDHCSIYEHRPATCRKYFVTGDPAGCLPIPGQASEVSIVAMVETEAVYSAYANYDASDCPDCDNPKGELLVPAIEKFNEIRLKKVTSALQKRIWGKQK